MGVEMCGVATANFPSAPQVLENLLVSKNTTMDFFWNWDTHVKVDTTGFSPAALAEIPKKFIPMIWGSGVPADGFTWLSQGTYVMLFNEPDQYGPWCCNSPQIYGCAPNQYSAATSSGWAPLFQPDLGTVSDPHASLWLQWMVNNMTVVQPKHPSGINTIVSPSMAQDAEESFDCVGIDPSLPSTPKACPGWMEQLKKVALTLDCTDFAGKATNCWDVLDVIQIHAYAKSGADVIDKVQGYYQTFQEDFEGTNGRSKKTLWITELAGGYSNSADQVQFIQQVFDPSSGLGNKAKFPYVEGVSWFSDYSFPSFNVSGVAPKQYETWSSSLFSFESLSPVGEAFFQACNDAKNAI